MNESDTQLPPAAEAPPPLFNTLPLDPKLLRAVAESGYTAMTPIQAKAIPIVLAGRDVMGAAQTGTGKTAAFSLPLLQKMLRHENASMSPARHPVRALVLAPTRELADQVADNVKNYAKHSQLRSAVVFGGIDMKPQTLAAEGRRRGADRHAGPPARPHRGQELRCSTRSSTWCSTRPTACSTSASCPTCSASCPTCPRQRQTLLFSATFSPEIRRLANSYLQDPVLVEVARPNATATNVEQRFYSVADDDKRAVVRADAAHARADAGAGLRQLQARRGAAGALLRARRPARRRRCTATSARTSG